MLEDIVLGTRGDDAHDRHFVGRLAGLVVGSNAVTGTQAQCLFKDGEELLHHTATVGSTASEMLVPSDGDSKAQATRAPCR